MLEREPVTGDSALEEVRREGAEPVLGDADLGGPERGDVHWWEAVMEGVEVGPVAADRAPPAPPDQLSDEAEGDTNGDVLEPEGQDSVQARVVAYLEAHDKLTHAEYGRARRLAEDGGDPILRMLVRLGLVSGRDLALALSDVLDLPLAESAAFPLAPVADGRFSLRFLKDNHVLPLREDGGVL